MPKITLRKTNSKHIFYFDYRNKGTLTEVITSWNIEDPIEHGLTEFLITKNNRGNAKNMVRQCDKALKKIRKNKNELLSNLSCVDISDLTLIACRSETRTFMKYLCENEINLNKNIMYHNLNQIDTIKYLIDINYLDSRDTWLYEFIKSGNFTATKLLIEYGKHSIETMEDDVDLLTLSIFNNKMSITKYLIDEGIEIKTEALICAINNENIEIIDHIFNRSINCIDRLVIDHLCNVNNNNITKYFIESGKCTKFIYYLIANSQNRDSMIELIMSCKNIKDIVKSLIISNDLLYKALSDGMFQI